MVEQGCGACGRGMNAPPELPGGDGAPPGGTRTSRQELADRGPLKHAVAEKRGPSPTRRRDGAPKGAACWQQHALLHTDAPIGAPSPRILRGTEWDYGLPGAAKNTG